MDNLNDSLVFFFEKQLKNGIHATNCEINTSYSKTIKFDRQMECALVEVSLPPMLYREKPKSDYIIIDFLFNFIDIGVVEGLTDGTFELLANPKFDFETQKHYVDTEVLSIKGLNGKQIHEKLLNTINKIFNEKAKKIFNNYIPLAFNENGEPHPDVIFNEIIASITQNGIKPGFMFFVANEGNINMKNKKFPDLPPVVVAKFMFDFKSIDSKIILGLKEEDSFLNYDHRFENAFANHYIYDENNLVQSKEEEYKIEKVFIYTDIVIESYVDGSKVNILRILPINKQTRYFPVTNSLYIPLRIKEINTIKISVRDVTSRKLYFKSGSLGITLQIRSLNKK